MSTIYRLLKKPFFGQFEGEWRWPHGGLQADWERIEFPSQSGAEIVGLIGLSKVEARGAVVMAHPMGRAAKGFWLKQGHAALLREHGFHVLLFDFNGFGESASGNFDYPADVLSAGQYAKQRFPHLPVALFGTSFGGGWSLCAMSRLEHPFRAAVLEGVFPTLPSFWRHYPAPYAALRVSQVIYPPIERSLRPVREAARLQHQPSILLIYGQTDPYTPPSGGEQLEQAMKGRADVKMWTLPNVEHAYALRDAGSEYKERVFAFLERTLSSKEYSI